MSVAIPARNLLPAYLKCSGDIVPKGKVKSYSSTTLTRLKGTELLFLVV